MGATHDCKPPRERRPIGDGGWTCPDCGVAWRAVPQEPTNPAPHFDFATNEGVSLAEWVREEDGAD